VLYDNLKAIFLKRLGWNVI